MKTFQPHIIFLNQMAGPLFRELAEDISNKWPNCLMFTGQRQTLEAPVLSTLTILPAPTYNRRSNIKRVISWIRYFIYIFIRCWKLNSNAILFLVSNPPILGLLGYFYRRIRGQKYVILVYDIYPDILVRFGKLQNNSILTKIWRHVNKLVWENAEIVFTIGDAMAANLALQFDERLTKPRCVQVVPNWADTKWLHPISKSTNDFANKYNQVNKFTVMYSGNLGATHDLNTILDTIRSLRCITNIHFMIIGEGSKYNEFATTKEKEHLDNLTLLPFLPESTLPFSLTTADAFIVTLDKGADGLMVPSKSYYGLAAGAAIIGLCSRNNEVAQIINEYDCGIIVQPGDIEALSTAIIKLSQDRDRLILYKSNSRKAAEKSFSRMNTQKYIDALSRYCFLNHFDLK